jgi:succinate dehydrogenase/fumarate reductase flavoprotein subunit
MMGNSLLECVVFGRRSGRAAAEAADASGTLSTTTRRRNSVRA